jgi:hypothetical protein
VPVIPLHRHQPCASAPTFIGPDRYARSTQPVDCVSASCASEQGSARPPAPSALVVPPDFDGLLRASPCGLVASRSRPWGSSRFQTPAADREWFMGISHATRGASAGDPFPGTLDPSKLFPCTQPSSGQRVLRLHLSLTPASPTILLLLARPDLSSSPRLASWPFTVGLPLSPLLPRLCHDPFESLLPQALFRALSRAGFGSGLARPLDLRVFLHVQIRCTCPAFPPCLCPMLPWAFCSARTVLGDHRPPRRFLVDRLQRFCCVANAGNRSHSGPT